MTNCLTNVIVNYLPPNLSGRELYSMFITVGPIISCKVMRDAVTGYSFGYGFVNYLKPEDAKRAIESLNGYQIYNKRIKVSYARPSTDDIKDTNLYITNLPRNFTEDDLEKLFSQFGTIVQKNLLLDKFTRKPRGVAFVRFNKRDEAQAAIKMLDGFVLQGCCESLCVRVAEEHGKRKAAYLAGLQAGLQKKKDLSKMADPATSFTIRGSNNLRDLAMA